LKVGEYCSALLPIPPLDEQRTIASYLDRNTGRIAVLVGKKERLIALLQEKRTALISHAVTKGLNPTAPMKDSGVEWLGQIPAHWGLVPLGHLLEKITYGFTNPMPIADEGPFLLTANDIGDGEILFNSARRTSQEAFDTTLTDKSRPRSGDILITKDGTLGRVAVAGGSRMCINQSVAMLRAKTDAVSVEFLQNTLRAQAYQDCMAFNAGGTTIKHIYITRLAKMLIALPALKEQREICSFVNTQRAMLDALSAKVRTGIERLQEYRTALISAAVTGKIDVRGQTV
jgi:type I restriction enzyme S subunit